MPRQQFTLRALLLAMLVVAAFFGGMTCERERARLERANTVNYTLVKPVYDPSLNTE